MRVIGTWQGKRHFKTVGPSGHELSVDAKAEAGGEDKGARPMELLLMGLIGCTGIDVSMILERMRQPMDSLEITAEGARREEHPQAFTDIRLVYRIAGEVDADKAWRAIHLSENKYCSASASFVARIVPVLILNGTEVPADESTSTDLPD